MRWERFPINPFVESDGIIQPFKFIDPNKGIPAFSFMVIQELENGRKRAIKTEDSRLAGMKIPMGIENTDKLLHEISNYLDSQSQEQNEIIAVNGAEIVRSEKTTEVVEPQNQQMVANFIIKPIEHIIYVDRAGNRLREREKFLCEIIFINNNKERFEILLHDIKDIVSIVKRRFHSAIVDYEVKKADKIIETNFRKETESCPCTICYVDAGWQKINSKWLYLSDDIAIRSAKVDTGLNLKRYNYTKNQIGDVFLKAYQLYADKASMAVMLAFSLMGVLYKPFVEAGYTPHFALFLNGKTGSMKTTIGKILYTQLCEEEYRDFPRRIDSDSAVSLERGIVVKGCDTITLIDDYSPAKTEQKKREMNDKVEMVIRMVGDGSSRSRSNVSLEDKRGEGVKGMVAITGELRGKGISSNLRCFYCKMEREYANTDIVTWFQENPYAYCTFIAEYTKYLSEYWETVSVMIKRLFPSARKDIGKVLTERRLVDSTAMLYIATYNIRDFLINWCGMSASVIDNVVDEMQDGIVKSAIISQQLSVEELPSVTFIRAIDDLIRINSIVLKIYGGKDEISYEDDGFEDNENYYFNPEIVHKKVISFINSTNRYFPFDLKETMEMLADDKIIQTAPNGTGKRTFCQRILFSNGKKYRFLKLNKVMFENIVQTGSIK